MSNVVDLAKTDVSQARSGFRGWIAAHPFQYTLYVAVSAMAVGFLVGVIWL